MDLMPFIVAMGIPSGISGIFFWLIKRELDKRQKESEKREKDRQKYELQLLESVGAAIALGEATAKAMQRIPDAKCNGDMHAALEYAQKIKHKQKDFINEQFIENMY